MGRRAPPGGGSVRGRAPRRAGRVAVRTGLFPFLWDFWVHSSYFGHAGQSSGSMHGVNNFIFYPHDLNSLSAAQGMAGLTACPLCECRVASRRVASRSAPSTCDMAPPSARPPVDRLQAPSRGARCRSASGGYDSGKALWTATRATQHKDTSTYFLTRGVATTTFIPRYSKRSCGTGPQPTATQHPRKADQYA